MNNLAVSRFLVGVFGFSLLLIGLVYIVQPLLALRFTGDFQLDSSALTDVRATYGGIQLGLGLYLLLVLRAGVSLENEMLLLCLAFAAVGATRLVGYLVGDEVASLHLYAAIAELIFACVAAVIHNRFDHPE